jgi:hypothetical protein
MESVFSESEIDQFIQDGYVVLRNAFSERLASKGRDFIWQKLEVSENKPSEWTEKIIHIQEAFSCPPFDEMMNSRIRTAVEELTGRDRAYVHEYFGWWAVLFPGFPGPGGWHVDGSNFHHRLRSNEQGLVTLYLFSDIGHGDGGTAIAIGSHKDVARILAAAEPDGLAIGDLIERLPVVDPRQVVEVSGKAGDVAFLHPFLIHGFSANDGSRIRFACNPQYPLRKPMNLDRDDGDHSPVEEAIRIAIS